MLAKACSEHFLFTIVLTIKPCVTTLLFVISDYLRSVCCFFCSVICTYARLLPLARSCTKNVLVRWSICAVQFIHLCEWRQQNYMYNTSHYVLYAKYRVWISRQGCVLKLELEFGSRILTILRALQRHSRSNLRHMLCVYGTSFSCSCVYNISLISLLYIYF